MRFKKMLHDIKLFFLAVLLRIVRVCFDMVVRGRVLDVVLASRGYFTIGSLANSGGFFEGERRFLSSGIFAVGGSVLDVGANFGEYSSLALDFGFASATLIEPNPICIERLRVRFETNDKVSILHTAISDRTGNVTLRFPPGGIGEGTVVDAIGRGFGDEASDFVVPSAQLNDLNLDFDLFDLIKIDVEGSEWAVLQQLSILVGSRNRYIQFEFNKHHARVGMTIDMVREIFPEYQLKKLDLLTGELMSCRVDDPLCGLFLPSIFVLVRNN